MTIVIENSGIYKKGRVQMVCNGDGLGPVRVCVRVCARFLKAAPARITRGVSKHSATNAKCLLAAGGCGIVVGVSDSL